MSESQTPRTDKAKFKILSDLQSGTRDVVSVEVSEEIESELTATRARLAERNDSLVKSISENVELKSRLAELEGIASRLAHDALYGGNGDSNKEYQAYKEGKK